MANLYSAAVATLASEIADLRKALEGTLIGNAARISAELARSLSGMPKRQ
jgi:hypothetical protein